MRVEDKFYLSLEHYMETKKYEGTLLENALLECKTLKEFYSIITPRIYTQLSEDFFIIKKECIIHDGTCYFEKEGWEREKVKHFAKFAKSTEMNSLARKIYDFYISFVEDDIKTLIRKFKIKKIKKEEFNSEYIKYLFFKNSKDEQLFKILFNNI